MTDKSETSKSWYFISDAHLSENDKSRQEMLIRFLEQNQDRMECLVILGDLFDFWFGFPDYIDPDYGPLCDALLALSQKGVRLIYLEGNHDFSVGDFFSDTLQGEVFPGDHLLEIDGYRVFLSHGDLANSGELGYRLYRRLLKNRGVYALIRFLGPMRTKRIKDFLNGLPWMHRRKSLAKNTLSDERYAEKKCRQGADVVILGHTHHPHKKTFVLDGRTCYYFNVGDWIEHFSYLRYHSQSGFHLETHRPEAGQVTNRPAGASAAFVPSR